MSRGFIRSFLYKFLNKILCGIIIRILSTSSVCVYCSDSLLPPGVLLTSTYPPKPMCFYETWTDAIFILCLLFIVAVLVNSHVVVSRSVDQPLVIVIVIVISEFLVRHSKAKRTRAPDYSRALRQINGVVHGKLRPGFQRVRASEEIE